MLGLSQTTLLVPLVILVISAVVLGIAYRRRRRGPSDQIPRRGGVAGTVVVIATVSALVTGVTTVVAAVTTATAEQVSVTVPVRPFILERLPQIVGLDGPTAEIAYGPGFTEGTFGIEGLDGATRAWLVVGGLVNGAVLVLILLAVASIAQRARMSTPFAKPISPVLWWAGIALAFGSVVWQICFITAGNLAAEQLFRVDGVTAVGLDERELARLAEQGLGDAGWPVPDVAGTVELWPLGVGLALIALAAVFRSAERLQRDTEGLV